MNAMARTVSARYAALYTPVGTLVRFTFNDGGHGKAEHLTTREARVVRGRGDQVTTVHGTHRAAVHVTRVRDAVEIIEEAPLPPLRVSNGHTV